MNKLILISIIVLITIILYYLYINTFSGKDSFDNIVVRKFSDFVTPNYRYYGGRYFVKYY